MAAVRHSARLAAFVLKVRRTADKPDRPEYPAAVPVQRGIGGGRGGVPHLSAFHVAYGLVCMLWWPRRASSKTRKNNPSGSKAPRSASPGLGDPPFLKQAGGGGAWADPPRALPGPLACAKAYQ
jgi:hypothetical protein